MESKKTTKYPVPIQTALTRPAKTTKTAPALQVPSVGIPARWNAETEQAVRESAESTRPKATFRAWHFLLLLLVFVVIVNRMLTPALFGIALIFIASMCIIAWAVETAEDWSRNADSEG